MASSNAQDVDHGCHQKPRQNITIDQVHDVDAGHWLLLDKADNEADQKSGAYTDQDHPDNDQNVERVHT